MSEKSINGQTPPMPWFEDEMIVVMRDIENTQEPNRTEIKELILDLTAIGTGKRENPFIKP